MPSEVGGRDLLRLAAEADLGTAPIMPVGTRVEIEDTGRRFVGVGGIRREVISRLGWAPGNVWIPEPALNRMLSRRSVFPDLLAAVQVLLLSASSVHVDRELEQGAYFVIAGDLLRKKGLLTSQSAAFVDGVVESRQVPGGSYLRLFHLGPTKRVKGGTQIWP